MQSGYTAYGGDLSNKPIAILETPQHELRGILSSTTSKRLAQTREIVPDRWSIKDKSDE
jgi:hypothetical protein